jgi:hypothetical protein
MPTHAEAERDRGRVKARPRGYGEGGGREYGGGFGKSALPSPMVIDSLHPSTKITPISNIFVASVQ